jgi:hypothetical protein
VKTIFPLLIRNVVFFLVLGCSVHGIARDAEGPFQVLEKAPYRILFEKGLERSASHLVDIAPKEIGRIEEDLGVTEIPKEVTVYLITGEGKSPVIPEMPYWAAGIAVPSHHIIVLQVSRLGYPYKSIDQVFVHELCHILLHEAVKARQGLPRWFEEGTCMIEAREWGFEDSYHVLLGLLFRRHVSLDDLDALFQGNSNDAEVAYALGFSFVSDLVARTGKSSIRRIIRFAGAGLPFETAFEKGTGVPFWAAVKKWEKRTSSYYRLLPILTSTTTLWVLITLLFLLAVRRKKAREREVLERWEWEDDERWPPYVH